MSVSTLPRAERDLALCERVYGRPAPVVQDVGCVRGGCTRHAQWRTGAGGAGPTLCTRDAARRLRRAVAVATARANRRQAMLAAVAALVLRRWPHLPVVASVGTGTTCIGGVDPRSMAALQITGGESLSAVAAWAQAFEAPVRVVVHATYVEVSTETVVDGHVVAAWDHLPSPADLPPLAERLGVTVPDVGGQFEVSAQELLAAVGAVTRG
jgi:hypothetical protein